MAIDSILSTLDSLANTQATAGNNIGTGAGIGNASDIAGIGGSGGVDFGSTLNRLVNAVESSNAQANQATIGMVDGTTDVHDAMIALQRADMTFQLTMQIRNKLVNAYQEMMRMPV
jgi:flagellar hook-basal body complex protein FliE